MLTKFVSLIDAELVLEGLILHKLGYKTSIFNRNISNACEKYIVKPHHKGAVIFDVIYDIILPFSRNIYRFPPPRSIWRLHRKINFKIIGDVEALPSYHALFYKSLLFRRIKHISATWNPAFIAIFQICVYAIVSFPSYLMCRSSHAENCLLKSVLFTRIFKPVFYCADHGKIGAHLYQINSHSTMIFHLSLRLRP